ncbi:MAG: hypothetical protein ACJ760_05365 [Thermoleophilaceae bacterium]
MRVRLRLVVALVAVAMGVSAPAALGASGWYELGPDQNQFTPFDGFDLVDSSGTPLIAWDGVDPNDQNQKGVFTAAFDGHPLEAHPWKDFAGGNAAFAPDGGSDPSLATVGGTLYAAAVSQADGNVRVERLVGTTWQAVGGSLNIDTNESAEAPHIADVGGVPYVSWVERDGNCTESELTARVKRWNGSSWVAVGTGARPLSDDTVPQCDYVPQAKITDIGGKPYVAMLVQTSGVSGTKAYVKRYDTSSSSWVTEGGGPVSDPSLLANSVSLAEVVSGIPYVAYTEGPALATPNTHDLVHVKRFASGSWQTIGGGPLNHDPNQPGGGCQGFCEVGSASIAGRNSTPYVAWVEYDGTALQLRVARLNDNQSGWAELGGSVNHAANLSAHKVELRFVNGDPVVGWTEDDEPPSGDSPPPTDTHVAAYGQAPRNFRRPGMTGSPKVGSRLRCTLGTWSRDASGYRITWERAPHGTPDGNTQSWVAIHDAVGPSYTLQDDDAGSRVRCRVSAAGSVFTGDARSNSLQADFGPPRNTVLPQVKGDFRTGHDVTCDPGAAPGSWTNNPNFTYEWYGNAGKISGATGQTYHTHSPGDADEALACRVIGRNDLGEWGVYSHNVHIVAHTPKNRTRPFMQVEDGPNPAGRQARCTPGTWSYNYGDYSWQWARDDGQKIAGAVGPTYTTTIDDLGHEIYCIARSRNPIGLSAGYSSNKELIPLPQGVGKGTLFKTGGRNEFDPVNFMALSDGYTNKLEDLIVPRLQHAVDLKRKYCANTYPDRDKIPDKTPVYDPSDFDPLKLRTLCTILVRSPESDIDIGRYGVQYLGPIRGRDRQPHRCEPRGFCADLGFKVNAVTPGQQGTLPTEIRMQLAPVSPERVLWDFDGDQRIDAECPAGSPVVRTMLDSGHWNVHAVIVDRDSAQTGVYWNAGGPDSKFDFDHPPLTKKDPGPRSKGQLRPGQVFACRSSVSPPPDPEVGSCVNAGNIGRVQIVGNFCPINLRAVDPDILKGLKDTAPAVYTILKTMADNQPVRKASRREGSAETDVPLGTAQLGAADYVFGSDDPYGGSINLGEQTDLTVAYINTSSAMTAFDDDPIDPLAEVPGSSIAELEAKLAKNKFDKEHANFALDQIYLGKGPARINGTTLAPNGGPDASPTLITPSDAGNASKDGTPKDRQIVQSMILNNPDVRTALGAAGDITLDPKGAVDEVIGDVKNQAEDQLRKTIDIEAYKKQLKDELKGKGREARDAALAALDKLDLGPLKITGTSAQLKINDDGTVTLTAEAAIPFLQDSSATPSPNNLDPTEPTNPDSDPNAETDKTDTSPRVRVVLKGDLRGNLTLEGVHLHLPSADLGVIKLGNLDVDYNHSLTVSGDFLLPPTKEGVRVQDFTIDDRGRFRGLSVFYLAGAGGGIPIGSPAPIYLTSLGGGFHFEDQTINGRLRNVAHIDGGATFSVGPSPTGGGCATLGFDTKANVFLGGDPFFRAILDGAVQVVCIPLVNVHFEANSDGLVTLAGRTSLNVGPIFVKGDLLAGIDARTKSSTGIPNYQFGIDGSGGIEGVPFLDDISMSALVSNVGVAGCGSIKVPIIGHVAGGAAVRFNGGIPPLTLPQLIANIRLFTGCDLGDYKTVLKRAALRSASVGSSAVSTSSFTMRKSQRGALVSLEGAGHAPLVKLKSPSGKIYDLTRATHGVRFSNGIGQIVAAEDRTVALLVHPQPGTWTVLTAAGSAPVTRIQIAPLLPPPSVKGHVTGKGASRTLHYSVARRAGQVVRFEERAQGSIKTLGTVRVGGKGTLHYLTGEARSKKRTILGEVSQNGLPRRNVVIARYVAPNPTVGRPTHVRIVRKAKHAVVRWRPARVASYYLVGVTDTLGGRKSYYVPNGRTSLTISNVARTTGLHVRVVGVSRGNRRGPPGEAVLKAPRRHHGKP